MLENSGIIEGVRGGKKSTTVKVYAVLQHDNVAKNGAPNERIIAVKLTRSAAQHIVDQFPGTRIEKHYADKSGDCNLLQKP